MNNMTSPENPRNPLLEGSSIPEPRSYHRWMRATGLLYTFNDLEVEGKENLPPVDEPTLFVPTHRGGGDIYAVHQALLPERLARAVAKDKVFDAKPKFGQKMRRSWDTIRVDDNNIDAFFYLSCLSTFHREKDPHLVIYPEATRKRYDLEKVEDTVGFGNIARLALYGRVQVVPVGVWGTQKRPHMVGFSDLFVVFGEPLGPYVSSASYDLVMDGRNVDMAQSRLGKLSPQDRKIRNNARLEIVSGLQTALNKAIANSEK